MSELTKGTKTLEQKLPAHLREDASYIQCSWCGRKSWGGEEVNVTCGMSSPYGGKCKGVLEGKTI